jgi:hypothetical protein
MKKIINLCIFLLFLNTAFGQGIIVHQKAGKIYKQESSQSVWKEVKNGDLIRKGYIRIEKGGSILISKASGEAATVFRKTGKQFKISDIEKYISNNSNDAAKVLWQQVNNHHEFKISRGGVTRSGDDSIYLLPYDSSNFVVNMVFKVNTNNNIKDCNLHVFNDLGIDTLVNIQMGFVFNGVGEYHWEILNKKFINETPRKTIFILSEVEFASRMREVEAIVELEGKNLDIISKKYLRNIILDLKRIYFVDELIEE